MSAAKKLNALEPFHITMKMTAYAGPEIAYQLYDVPLPQIVAVVEAAAEHNDECQTVSLKLALALDALEEALREIESMSGAGGSGEIPAMPIAARARRALAHEEEAEPPAPDPRLIRRHTADGAVLAHEEKA